MAPLRLISFGYLHQPIGPDGLPIPPEADRIEDVRERLRDPAAARSKWNTSMRTCPASRTRSSHDQALRRPWVAYRHMVEKLSSV
ncbi:hypothetical protein [Nonomuraea sp. NEAU-A123]|uniref:hypothetical protein n=1 Tax=Nonomuraea sp. NEAU-A123 TaxID=2839649 RepID=UPI001BE44945|nr:hypothetical protein [Nonomuraea sp. NEAU-A123]MBT2227654.1 hypothetical protein [Nonomuraea sp. NEAU-A123]